MGGVARTALGVEGGRVWLILVTLVNLGEVSDVNQLLDEFHLLQLLFVKPLSLSCRGSSQKLLRASATSTQQDSRLLL